MPITKHSKKSEPFEGLTIFLGVVYMLNPEQTFQKRLKIKAFINFTFFYTTNPCLTKERSIRWIIQ